MRWIVALACGLLPVAWSSAAAAFDDELRRGECPERPSTSRGDDLVVGGGGSDVLRAGKGDETVIDTEGRNRLHDGRLEDRILVALLDVARRRRGRR